MVKYFKFAAAIVLSLTVIFQSIVLSGAEHKNYGNNEIKIVIESLIDWKKR